MARFDLKGVCLEGDERVDQLSSARWIIQRARGHRATTDDQLLAWAVIDELTQRSAHPAPQGAEPLSVLELGAGKGTVTFWLSEALQSAVFFGIEAFEESFKLSLKNRQLNALESRFFPTLGDLRAPERWSELRSLRLAQLESADPSGFDVITGAPPFMPLGSGVLPQDPQRAAGRFELKGGVEGYLSAVKGCLSKRGFSVILMDGAGEQRALRGATAEGLTVQRVMRVTPRPNRPATYALLWLSASPTEGDLTPPVVELSMRGDEGEAWSDAYLDVRRRLGV